MAASRLQSLFFRHSSKLRYFRVQQRQTTISISSTNMAIRKCSYSTNVVASMLSNGSSLDRLISNLTEENNNNDGTEITTINNVENLKKICSQLEDPISNHMAVKILSRFAEIANENDDIQKAADYLRKGLLVKLEEALKKEQLNVNWALEAMCSVIILELTNESIFKTLIDALRRHFFTDLFCAPVSPIIRLAALVNSKNVRLPNDLFRQIREWLQLKASEITEPKDVVSVMICWNKNDNWFNMFIEKAKGTISSMSSGELVGTMASLANNSCRPPHVLRLICSTFEHKKDALTVNQLIVLAQSAAKLRFMDGRLRRLIADETVANISRFTKWSQINALVDSMAKLRIGDLRAWNAVSAWINNNQMNASTTELSYAVHWCAIAGKGDLIQEAGGHLCEKLSSSVIDPPKALLSSIYALATCDRLSPELAQVVLQPSFITNLLEGLNGFRKLMAVTTLAQVQLFLKAILNKAYQGPLVNILDLMELSPAAANDMALKLRYGKSEEGNVQYFHSLLHKLIPINSYAFPPALTEDGIFVNAVVKLDVRANRFVPLSHFEETKVPRLAVIYLSWKDRTLTCNDGEKSTLMGPLLLNMRLLKARGFVPVLFSQDDFDSASLKQQFTLIKTKLEEASNDTESR